jgi:hypothetical protein
MASTARPAHESAALRKAISADRIGTYSSAAARTGCDELDLYVWDRDVASAVLADIAIVEVALRNALHSALSSAYKPDWYLVDIGLDSRSQRALGEAWNFLKKEKRTPGKIVARLMFGFWVGLLDAGGYRGSDPQAFKCDYEQLFRSVLRRAFPGGPAEARQRNHQFSREWLHSLAAITQDLRNRAAHHEPLVGGFPLNGQRDKHGNVVRYSVQQGFDTYVLLTRTIDRDLGTWLATNSTVPALLAAPPTPAPAGGHAGPGPLKRLLRRRSTKP